MAARLAWWTERQQSDKGREKEILMCSMGLALLLKVELQLISPSLSRPSLTNITPGLLNSPVSGGIVSQQRRRLA
jgi:hypothetical protein